MRERDAALGGGEKEGRDIGKTDLDKSGVVSERSATATLMIPLAGPPRSRSLLKLGIMKQTFYSAALTSHSGRFSLSVFARGL